MDNKEATITPLSGFFKWRPFPCHKDRRAAHNGFLTDKEEGGSASKPFATTIWILEEQNILLFITKIGRVYSSFLQFTQHNFQLRICFYLKLPRVNKNFWHNGVQRISFMPAIISESKDESQRFLILFTTSDWMSSSQKWIENVPSLTQ